MRARPVLGPIRPELDDYVRPADRIRAIDNGEPGVFTWKFWAFVALMTALYALPGTLGRWETPLGERIASYLDVHALTVMVGSAADVVLAVRDGCM